MFDLRITLGWILMEPMSRCEQFVLYGLGQTKPWIDCILAATEFRARPLAPRIST